MGLKALLGRFKKIYAQIVCKLNSTSTSNNSPQHSMRACAKHGLRRDAKGCCLECALEYPDEDEGITG